VGVLDFKIENKHKDNIIKYTKDEIDVTLEFSKEAKKELKELLRAIVLFGSTARKFKTGEQSNDIDVLLILDDVSIQLSQELIQAYRIIIEKIIVKVSRRLHITSLRFTNFWEYVRAGDPIAINMLRDGVPILDTGFFAPLQLLLSQGRIRPSPEAIQNYLSLAPQTLQNSKGHILQATLDLYWSVIDAAHAALMSINETPPSPSHVAEMLEEKLVKTKLIDERYALIMKRFYSLGKSIMHGEVNYVSGEQYDVYYKEAHGFVMELKRFIENR
jgi:uncharacterized protein (UPF0332 family)/predicted nucleotidyltransferase